MNTVLVCTIYIQRTSTRDEELTLAEDGTLMILGGSVGHLVGAHQFHVSALLALQVDSCGSLVGDGGVVELQFEFCVTIYLQ